MSFAGAEFGNRGAVGLPGAVFSPYGARTFYVHHNASQAYSDLPPEISQQLFTTIHQTMSVVESGRGDVIQLLPGHAENINSATYITQTATKTGFCILGPKHGAPATLTWSTPTAVFSMPANSVIDGGRDNGSFGIVMEMAGDPTLTAALSVAAPIKFLAAGAGVTRCKAHIGVDADQLATIAFTTDANGDDCFMTANHIYGATLSEVTTAIDVIGADNFMFANNYVAGATSSTGVGMMRFATTASLHIHSCNNRFANRKAASAAAVTGLAAVSGVSAMDHVSYLDNASLTVWLTSPGIMSFHRPTVSNAVGETGTEVAGVVSA